MAPMASGVEQAFHGFGPVADAIRIERARALAEAAPPPLPRIEVLVLAGRAGRWALPVAAAARVEVLGPSVALPTAPPCVLGLALVGGRRCLLVDPDVVLAGAPRRPPVRPGHVALLRHYPVALAVDRALAVSRQPRPADGARVLADGSVLVDPAQMRAAAMGGGG